MIKKMTVTLEEELLNKLDELADNTAKRKSQLVKEALQDYFDVQSVSQTVQEYKMGGGLKTVSHNDMRAEINK
jgi:predicted transcriptional regulator